MNCDKLGGRPAKCSEETIVNHLTIKHIVNHCSVHFTLHRIDCEIETKLSAKTVACLTKLNKPSPHQFAQVFKAAGKTNPDILSHKEVHQDCDNIKKWLAAARKETEQLEQKGTERNLDRMPQIQSKW